MENTDEVVAHAINAATLLGWGLVGGLVGVVVFLISLAILALMGRRYRTLRAFVRRTRAPMFFSLLVTGMLVGYRLADVEEETFVYLVVQHALLLTLIGCIGWLLYASVGVIQDMTRARLKRDPRGAQRLQTQSQVLQRVLQSIVVISTLVAMALTFPAARAPLASLLGAAGVLSVVTGLAAQTTLGNVFAGIQLAFTDAIRVGDTVTVTVDGSEEVGTIEELTLTYVVLRIWNERRVLLPSSYFTTQPFENWTRTGTDQLGKVELKFDWPVPMAQVRLEAQKILAKSELWDHRTWNVQVTESDGQSMTVRIVVSATTPGNRWDLECEVREKMLAWASSEIPWALPRLHTEREETRISDREISDQRVAELAEDLQQIAAQTTPKDDSQEIAVTDDPVAKKDPVHATKLRASRRKAKEARRKSILHREVVAQSAEPPLDSTMLMTAATDVAADFLLAKGAAGEEDGDGTRLYSGSQDAQARAKLFAGPGDDVFKEREQTAVMQALDAQGKLREPSRKDREGKGQEE